MFAENVTVSAEMINGLVKDSSCAVRDRIQTMKSTYLQPSLELFMHDKDGERHATYITLPPETEKGLLVMDQIARDMARKYLKVDIATLISLGKTTIFDAETKEEEEMFGIIVSAHSVCNKSSSAIMEVKNLPQGSPIQFTGNDLLDEYNPDHTDVTDILGFFKNFYIAHLEELQMIISAWYRRRKLMCDPCMN